MAVGSMSPYSHEVERLLRGKCKWPMQTSDPAQRRRGKGRGKNKMDTKMFFFIGAYICILIVYSPGAQLYAFHYFYRNG